MVEYMLGSYLVKTGRMDKRQLSLVLDKMDSVRVKLGLIAVSEGFMTFTQAEEVNTLQSVMDKRFGDIAVEKGYLTEEQVGKLLRQQGNTYLTFAQTLVDEGIAKLEEFDELLEQFRKDGGYTISELDAIRTDDVDAIVPIMMQDEMGSLTDLVGTAIRTVIRLIDRHACLEKAIEYKVDSFAPASLQELQMQDGSEYSFFTEDDGGLLELASFFGQMDFEKLDEDALDSAAELLNCINGLYASAQSKAGRVIELMPPVYSNEEVKLSAAHKYLVPFIVEGKRFYFGVAKTN